MFAINVEQATLANRDFRKVINTNQHMQLVLMSLKPREDIGLERHPVDQFFRIEEGHGIAWVEGAITLLEPGVVIMVPGQALHNIINTSFEDTLQLYTIYCPPQHKPFTVARLKPHE